MLPLTLTLVQLAANLLSQPISRHTRHEQSLCFVGTKPAWDILAITSTETYFAAGVLLFKSQNTEDKKLYQLLSRSVNFSQELPVVCILNKPICACAAPRVHSRKCSSKDKVNYKSLSCCLFTLLDVIYVYLSLRIVCVVTFKSKQPVCCCV